MNALGHNQKQNEADDHQEEEALVIHNRADERHLTPAGGKDTCLGKFVQACDQKLRGDEQQYETRDGKKLSQVDFQTALEERHSEAHREPKSDQAAHQVHQVAGAQGDRRKEEDGFNSLAQDHQEYEEEDAQSCRSRRGAGES